MGFDKALPYLHRISVYFLPVLMSLAFLYYKTEQVTEIHNFEFVKHRYFPEYNADIYLYRHKIHNSPYIHVKTSDQHNFFSTSFRTTCIDNTGSTHVLEHMVLHGSQKYPIPSVFTELMKRSLASFMNAFTSIEWTGYPFSSTNYKDFHNVLNVYLDSVFNPKLEEIDFQSECHHLEFEQPDNSSSKLRHSGVVYNEMNGAMSNPNEFFSQLVRQELYPDSVFHLNYGGNPPDVANLTFQKIKDQHNRYYSPSNALFFHYGSFDTSEVMKKVDDIITKFQPRNVKIPEELIHQPDWKEPKFLEEYGPGEADDTVKVAVSWKVGDLRNISDAIDLKILAELLATSAVSPLFTEYIKTDIAKKFIETGFMGYMRSPYFSIGLSGVNKSFAPKFNTSLIKLLQKISTEGFDQDHLQSTLHTLEINQRHVSSNVGLMMYESLVSQWIHDVDPFGIIDFSKEFKRIRNILKLQPRYFEMLIRSKLLMNTHRLDMVVANDPKFLEKQAEKVSKELEELKSKMSEKEIKNIIDTASEIRKRVDAPKPVELLPQVVVEDINKTAAEEKFEIDGSLYKFVRPTNGIITIRLSADIPMDHKDLALLPIIASSITNLGCDDLTTEQFTKQAGLHTGGFTASLSHSTPLTDNKLHASFNIATSSLKDDIEKTVELLRKLVLKPTFSNHEMIKIAITSAVSGFSSQISGNGHLYAAKYANAAFSDANALNEMWTGVTRYFMMKNNSKEFEKLPEVLQKLYKEVVLNAKFTASIHADQEGMESSQYLVKNLLDQLNSLPKTNYEHKNVITEFRNGLSQKKKTILAIDSATYYCSIAMQGPSYSNDFAAMNKRTIAVNLLKSEFLWDLVREKLGAYGIIGGHDRWNGPTYFVSYRDTNPVEVLKAYKSAINDVADGKINEAMLNRTKIQVFGQFDNPVAPSDSGIPYFLSGMTYETEQKVRDSLLAVSVQDVINEAKKMKDEEWTSAIVGSAKIAEKLDGYNVLQVIEQE